MLAGTGGYGLFMSTDLGASWQARNGTTSFPFIHSIIVVNDTAYVGSEGGLHRSTDWGATWQLLQLGFTPASVLSVLPLGTELFAATYQGGVVRSTDGGQSWTPANNGLPPRGALRLGAGGGRLFVALANGELFESTDQAGEAALPRLREMITANGFNLVDVNVSQHSFAEQQRHARTAGESGGQNGGQSGFDAQNDVDLGDIAQADLGRPGRLPKGGVDLFA